MALKLESRKGQAFCSRHRRWHPASEFEPKRSAVGGLEANCRKAAAESLAAYHASMARKAARGG